MTSKLIIIRGNSGSGKSTIAKELQLKLGYETMLIPQDIIRREILRVKDTANNPSISLIKDLALYGKSLNYDVIIEGILPKERYGRMLESLIGEFELSFIYYFNITFEETLRRHKYKSNSHEFGETEMRRWWVENDVLGYDSEKLITDSMTKSEIHKTISTDIESASC